MAKSQASTPGDDQMGEVPAQENVPVEFVEDDEPITGDFVQYTGGASIRLVTRREWEQAGVGHQAEVSWTVANRHLVSVDQFSDAARERVLKEPDFRIVNAADVS
jgi:hypothetical protein